MLSAERMAVQGLMFAGPGIGERKGNELAGQAMCAYVFLVMQVAILCHVGVPMK